MLRRLLPYLVAVLLPGALLLTLLLLTPGGRASLHRLTLLMHSDRTVDDRLREFGGRAEAFWRARCAGVGLDYPPEGIAMAVFKDRRTMVVLGRRRSAWRVLEAFDILGLSGSPGPKLREGDRQVPEGIYPIESLNPNSRFHVSLRLEYPSAFDRSMADADGRNASRVPLGSDIMIHGGSDSVGCLAMGDPTAELLFALAAACGPAQCEVIVAPCDLRARRPELANPPDWLPALYDRIESRLRELDLPRVTQPSAPGSP